MAKKDTNWWDKLGKPQHGGEMVLRIDSDIAAFDPYVAGHHLQIYSAWLESLFTDDWKADPAVYRYELGFPPLQFVKGYLAESGEFVDSSTYVVHLRKGIRWQNIAPVNGREFTADDVAYHYHRLYGLGSGFKQPSPTRGAADVVFQSLKSVTASDKYTVAFKWDISNPEFITEAMVVNHNPRSCIVAREVVEKWGDLNDWHHAIGTGAFILQDVIPGRAATLVRNPDYRGYDERYPQNKLPYVDKLKVLIIPDQSEAVEAMRAGKIDAVEELTFQQAQSLIKTNPGMLQFTRPKVNSGTIDPRNDRPPFNDIRVRKAMQMAIDLPTIVRTCYHNTADPYPQMLTSSHLEGWGFPYKAWPQDLKDEYSYNPTVARKLLADAGYPNGFKTNIIANSDEPTDVLQTVKSYFAAVGIDMEIRGLDNAAYTECRNDRKYDQMVDNINDGTLGMVNEPINHLKRLRTGFKNNYSMISDPVFDAFYPAALASKNLEELKQIVRDANERVARQHYTISLVQPHLFGLVQPWLKGHNGQFGAQTDHNQLLSFYLARFWIDQKLKKSMGH